jgi:hypothetical protein
MNQQSINRLSGYVIMALSLFAMLLVCVATILAQLGRFNPAPNGDEGAAAHLFQLAIVMLVPTGLVFVVTADWRRPLQVAKRVVIPAVALVIAFATLYYMEHMR